MKRESQSAEGRPGGGLFTTDGSLASVCLYADQNEKTGLYLAPHIIQDFWRRNMIWARTANHAGSPRVWLSILEILWDQELQIAGSQIAKDRGILVSGFFAICDPAICNLRVRKLHPFAKADRRS